MTVHSYAGGHRKRRFYGIVARSGERVARNLSLKRGEGSLY
jgi:hypothetical protein